MQDKSWIRNAGAIGLLELGLAIHTQPWVKDWDEADYMYPLQQSELWTCGGVMKNMEMWDDPDIQGIAGLTFVEYEFRAYSKSKMP